MNVTVCDWARTRAQRRITAAREVLGRSGEPAPVLNVEQWDGVVKSA